MRLAIGALALAALSLLVQRALAFDPEAWVVWGREAWSLAIDTTAGPSWKPGPVIVTAPLAIFGGAAPWLWLVVARAGALLGLAALWRLGGPVAAALLVLAQWWVFNAALANAEPLLIALAAWAAVAHLAGRHRAAFALGCAAALLRVEVWPFLAVYGLWLRGREVWLLGAGVLALWVVPDWLSSGLDSLRGAAQFASEGSAANTAFPFGTVLGDAFDALGPPVLVAALLAKQRVWLAAGTAWIGIVAVMAQAGFAGNPRYLIPGLAALALAAATAVRGRTALSVALVAATVGWVPLDLSDLAARDRARASLEAAGDRPCSVRTDALHRSVIARAYDESIPQAAARRRPGDAIARLSGERWTVSSCGR